MKETAYYIKTTTLMVLMFLESLYLTKLILDYIRLHSYFSFQMDLFFKVGIVMLLLSYTYSLTVGAWDTWEQYWIVTVPIALGIFFNLAPISLVHAGLVALVASVFLIYDVYNSTYIRGILTKFDPKIILKFSTSGILFIFSMLAGFLILLNYSFEQNQASLDKHIETITRKQVQSSNGIVRNLTSLDIDLDLSGLISESINTFVQPYKNFIPPIIALIVFSFFQLLASIVFFIYYFSIDLIFLIARKSHFLNVELEDVKKERLTF